MKKALVIDPHIAGKTTRSFLLESNAIEGEYSQEAFEDAMKAWEHAIALEEINLAQVLNIHWLLMHRLRPDIAGKWRECDVYIGGERKAFHGKLAIEADMRDVLTVMYPRTNPDLAGLAKHAHILFERVHPFEDGNGRTGRILYNWHRLKLGLPIHVIHAGEEQMEYYKWFK